MSSVCIFPHNLKKYFARRWAGIPVAWNPNLILLDHKCQGAVSSLKTRLWRCCGPHQPLDTNGQARKFRMRNFYLNLSIFDRRRRFPAAQEATPEIGPELHCLRPRATVSIGLQQGHSLRSLPLFECHFLMEFRMRNFLLSLPFCVESG